MNHYKTDKWKDFKNSVIELDGNKCSVCGKSGNEVILQVHHREYVNGLKPWEYATSACFTLCRGCHASVHGIIKPKFGWEYQGDEDLGDLIRTCENCGNSLRYVFYIHHENWGTMEVGTYCCDALTDSEIASNLMESQRRNDERKERFTKSKRWSTEGNIYKIRQGNFDIEITQKDSGFFIQIEGKQSNTNYTTLEAAKLKVFDVIESGELIKYFKKNNINIDKEKKKRTKKGNL